MAEQSTGGGQNGEVKKAPAPTAGGLGIIRERSFVRTPNHQQQMNAKRRSLMQLHPQHQQQQQMRVKPALEIYRPPNVRIDGLSQNKLNVHAQEFTMNRSGVNMFTPAGNNLQHSKSSSNMQQQQFGGRPHPQMTLNNLTGHRTAILLSHPLQMGQLNMGMTMQGSQIPLVNSQSSGNILH
uniref:Uncharacterized protein n=1 Tax=Phlebotomus papatasi TaxID=29031 RepID=A0A1B0DL57_PHLPP